MWGWEVWRGRKATMEGLGGGVMCGQRTEGKDGGRGTGSKVGRAV